MTGTAAAPSTANGRNKIGAVLSWIAWLSMGFALAAQVTIWIGPASPELAVAEHLAVPLCACAVFSAAIALSLRRWGRLVASLALAVTLAVPTLGDSATAPAPSDRTRLKVLSVNLWHAALNHDSTIAALMNSEADVVGLVEVTEPWRRALQPVIEKYPYRVDCFEIEPDCETLLLSNWPIERPVAGRIWKSNPIIAGGEIIWHGRRLAVLVTHLTRPLVHKENSRWYDASAPDPAAYLEGSLPFNRQATQAGRLAKYLNGLAPDLVLLGDLNAAPWSRVQRAFRAKTGLRNDAGWAASWPAWLPWPFRMPLDHILARGHPVVTGFTAGARIDSDHFPVIAEIGWRD